MITRNFIGVANKGKTIGTGILMVMILFSMVGCQAPAKTPEPPSNADLSYNCSVSQGFNFKKDEQILVGHIEYLKIGDQEFNSDLNVTNPIDSSKLIKVFGVMSNIQWSGGYADPIQFSCQVSTDNKMKMATLTHKSLANTEVEMIFSVYDFDPKEKSYFKCFHSDSVKLKGLVAKSGGNWSWPLTWISRWKYKARKIILSPWA